MNYQVERFFVSGWPSASRKRSGTTSELGSPGRPRTARTKNASRRCPSGSMAWKRSSERPTTWNQQGAVVVCARPESVRISRGTSAQQRVSDRTPEFAAALVELVKTGGDTEADLSLATLQNYRGGFLPTCLERDCLRFPYDDRKMSRVRMTIDNSA